MDKTLVALIGVGALWLGAATTVDIVTPLTTRYVVSHSQKITSQAQLELQIEKERRRQCNKKIIGNLVNRVDGYAYRGLFGNYHISLGGWLATEITVAHEVFHICDGHLDYNGLLPNGTVSRFYHEPKTAAYTLLRHFGM